VLVPEAAFGAFEGSFGQWQKSLTAMIEIDGAYGEGGGQIVRTACSLAALTRQACHIVNIRQARKEPGLRRQHLVAIQALSEFCGGTLRGGEVGSGELTFFPGNKAAAHVDLQINTAASITLIAQCIIPALLSASGTVSMRFAGGATDTAFAPPLDYFRYVFVPLLQRAGVGVNTAVARRGYYPPGGADVTIEVKAATPRAVIMTKRGKLGKIRILSSAASILRPRKVAERQIEGVSRLLGTMPMTPECGVEYATSISAGSAVCIVAEFETGPIGASALGARGRLAEQVGDEAARQFLAEFDSPACLDRHMADQVLLYMALADGRSCVTVAEITSHCRTNMWVIEKFLGGKFEVKDHMIRWEPGK
jgi:RNA 3'-terminal phosphate cyclase (ATP)